MRDLPFHQSSAQELKDRLAAERTGLAFLVYRSGEGEQAIVLLGAEPGHLLVGRGPDAALRLVWDAEVSRAHAILERVGDAWTIVDDGLSRNGTFVNGERVHGRRRLEHGDDLRLGETHLIFLHADTAAGDATVT